MDKPYAATLNAQAKTAGFSLTNGGLNKMRSPQLEPM